MNKYTIKLLPKAYRDIEQIYSYISENFMVPNTAKNMVKSFEDEILNLEEFPYRDAEVEFNKLNRNKTYFKA